MSDSLQPHGLYNPCNSLGQNAGVGNLSLLQGIFPTQGSNPGLMHCRQMLYLLSHKGSPSGETGESHLGTMLKVKERAYIGWWLSANESSLVAQKVEHLPAMQATWVQSLVGEDSLEEGMSTHSSIFTWRIPWTEEPGRL